MKSRKILVTGGTGFLGSALVRRLVDEGHEVTSLDDGSRGRNRRLSGYEGRVRIVDGDVRDPQAMRRAAHGQDTVVHMASVNGTEFFYQKPEVVLDVGVRGMLNVLDACEAERVPELVFASSSEVYQTPSVIPTPEDVPMVIPDPRNPRYSYAGQKLIGELLALHCGGKIFDRVVIFRPHNVYGADMGFEHVIPQFAVRAAELAAKASADRSSGPIRFPIQGTGEQTRAFVHVDDFTTGLLRVVEAGKNGEIYHIGTREEVTIAQLARMVVEHFGRACELNFGPEPAGATPRRCPEIEKLEALGYAPAIPLADGLGAVVDWYANHADEQRRAA